MAWDIFPDGPAAPAIFALNWLVQSSVLLGLSLLVGGVLRRAGAAVQSTVYRVGLLAILLVPIASSLLVAMGLTPLVIVPPARSSAKPVEPTIVAAPLRAPAIVLAPGDPGRSLPSTGAVDRPKGLEGASPRVMTGQATTASPTPSAGPSRAAAGSGAISAALWMGLAAWLTGSVVLVVRLVSGHRSLARIRASSVFAEAAVTALCRELAVGMHVEAPAVLRAPFLSSPCLAGLRRPAILLPEDANEGLRETLIHELAHLARHDLLWNLLRRAATALFWVQPLLWVLSRRMETAAEAVCDDVVVHDGADRSRYAEHLLDLAERTLPPVALASVGIVASRSMLARRVRRLLDTSRPLSTRAGRRVAAAIVVLGLAGTLLVGLVGIGRRMPAAGVVPAPAPGPAVADAVSREGVSFSGRVVDKENGKPVAGASITLSWTGSMDYRPRHDGTPPPPVVAQIVARTDAEGRYTLTIPPERVAEPWKDYLSMRVAHPDFIPDFWTIGSLAELLKGWNSGEPRLPRTIHLERGVEYHAQVVGPDGKPAAGVRFEFSNWISSNADLMGQTDAQGRLRLRMPKTSALTIFIPRGKNSAPFEKFWGVDHTPARPEEFAPADLGTIQLDGGLAITGRLLDLAGKPIAGSPLAVPGLSPRFTLTDAQGRFRFTLMRPGNYHVYGDGYDGAFLESSRFYHDHTANRVIWPVDVYLQEGVAPPPLEMHEAPTVLVRVQVQDSRGRPLSGTPSHLREEVFVSGTVPNAAGVDRPASRFPEFGGPGASSINREPRDVRHGIDWSASARIDDDGRVTLHALKGLRNAHMFVHGGEVGTTHKTRLVPGGPLHDGNVAWIGTLDRDHESVTVIVYKCPTVVATIRTEGGEPPPADAQALDTHSVESDRPRRGTEHEARPGPELMNPQEGLERGNDGRFRTSRMIPDHDYSFYAQATGYVAKRVEHRSLPEGVTAELTLVLRKKPAPPVVGTPAPAFTVKTIDGRTLSLDELRGKFVLLHFWLPLPDWNVQEIAAIKTLRSRFASDGRLEVLGLCLASDPEEVARLAQDMKITWPQAALRDGMNDPIVQNYPQTGAVLIGPDGKLLVRDLSGDKIMAAVAEALGRK